MCFDFRKYLQTVLALVCVSSCFSMEYVDDFTDGLDGTVTLQHQSAISQAPAEYGGGALVFLTDDSSGGVGSAVMTGYVNDSFFGDFQIELDITYVNDSWGSPNAMSNLSIGIGNDNNTVGQCSISIFGPYIGQDSLDVNTVRVAWNNVVVGLDSPGTYTIMVKRSFGTVTEGCRFNDGSTIVEHWNTSGSSNGGEITKFWFQFTHPNNTGSAEARAYLTAIRLNGEVFNGIATGDGFGFGGGEGDTGDGAGDGEFGSDSGLVNGVFDDVVIDVEAMDESETNLDMIDFRTYEEDQSTTFLAKWDWLSELGSQTKTYEIELPLSDLGVATENTKVPFFHASILPIAGLVKMLTTFIIVVAYLFAIKRTLQGLVGQ